MKNELKWMVFLRGFDLHLHYQSGDRLLHKSCSFAMSGGFGHSVFATVPGLQ